MAQKVTDFVRKSYLTRIAAMFTDAEEEVLETGSNEICMPWAEGDEEGFVIVKVIIPKGQRDGGDAYDGYVEADGYAAKVKAKQEKAEQAAKEKEAKKARDAKMRAEKKALREREKEKKDE